ncbi:MAG: hypothetical protein ACOYIR_07660 [Christensenellales bacterium]|jgi:hypothetical protein
MKRPFALLLVTIALITLLFGCAKEQPPQPTPSETPSAETPTPTPQPQQSETPTQPSDTPAFEQKDGVFVIEDVETLTAQFKTVGDYIEATGAMGISWWPADDGSGELLISIEGAGVNAVVAVTPEGGTIEGQAEGEDTDVSRQTLDLPARLTDISWEFEGTGVDAIRGIEPGAFEMEVRAAFYDSGDETAIYSAEDVLPDAKIPEGVFVGAKKVSDEDGEYLLYSWRSSEPTPRGYKNALLYYYLSGGMVDSIELHVFFEE